MKKGLCALVLAGLCVASAAFGGCGKDGGNSGNADYNYNTVYAQAVELGYTGSLEDFIALISGKDGKDGVNGKDGVGIEKVEIVNGELIITYTNGGTINLGKIGGAENGEREKTHGQAFFGTDVIYPEMLWDAPTFDYCADLDVDESCKNAGVKGLFFTSVTYKGLMTKVAAYIGFPANASATNKVPAMVLVHGAGGTAMPQWVKYWNDLGYAAIAIDTEGAEPIEGVTLSNPVHQARNRYSGGALDPNYTAGPYNMGQRDGNEDIENQWMYHASSAAIAANSLISSFDCVDENKLGITGISYGSIVTSVAISYDDRFDFAMPVYGGVTIDKSCSSFYNLYYADKTEEYKEKYYQEMVDRWDTAEGLRNTPCKVYYITSTKDFAFSMDIASRCAEIAKGQCNFKVGYDHNNVDGSTESTIAAFANYCTGKTGDFIRIVKSPTIYNNTLKIEKYGNAEVSAIKVMATDSDRPYTGRSDGLVPNALANWSVGTSVKKISDTEYKVAIPESKLFYVVVEYAGGTRQVCSYLSSGPAADIEVVPSVGKFSISDNFGAGGVKVEDSHVYEYNNVSNHDVNGTINYSEALQPQSTPMQNLVQPGDGYIVYKLSAEEGTTLSKITLDFKALYAHMGGAYWYNAERMSSGQNELGANLYVEISDDNVNYTKIYDLNDENGKWIEQHNPHDGGGETPESTAACTLNPKLDLSAYIQNKTEVYVRLYMMHFTTEKTNLISDWGNGIPYNFVGIRLYSVSIKGSCAAAE